MWPKRIWGGNVCILKVVQRMHMGASDIATPCKGIEYVATLCKHVYHVGHVGHVGRKVLGCLSILSEWLQTPDVVEMTTSCVLIPALSSPP